MSRFILNEIAPYVDDFFFTSLTDAMTRDAIVIHQPSYAICEAPVFLRSKKSLEEHVQHIKEQRINKAVVVAENIEFLRQCPSIEYLWVIPAISAINFDYSPLYDMPNIKWLQCNTIYGESKSSVASVDYSKLQGLQRLAIVGKKGHYNVDAATELKILCLDQGQPASGTLQGAFSGGKLEELSICQSPIRTLAGIEDAEMLQKLDLAYNRRLEDISALVGLKKSLTWLNIEKCGRIQDFSVLSELRELEYLRLDGSNSIENLEFLRNTPKLKSLILFMNVEDGNLELCEKVPYVKIKNRKHYNRKDLDFLKGSI